MTRERQFCTFTLDGHLYGIGIDHVQEVLRRHPLTRVRATAQAVQGLMNLRGRIVTVVDLRPCLGLPPRAETMEPSNVVVQHAGRPVSLWVDEIGEVLTTRLEDREDDGNSRERPGHECIREAYKLDDRLLLVLDVPELMQRAFA